MVRRQPQNSLECQLLLLLLKTSLKVLLLDYKLKFLVPDSSFLFLRTAAAVMLILSYDTI